MCLWLPPVVLHNFERHGLAHGTSSDLRAMHEDISLVERVRGGALDETIALGRVEGLDHAVEALAANLSRRLSNGCLPRLLPLESLCILPGSTSLDAR
jgi:hypothetical protein